VVDNSYVPSSVVRSTFICWIICSHSSQQPVW